MKPLLSRLVVLLVAALVCGPAAAVLSVPVSLYDPAAGLPAAQGWTTASNPFSPPAGSDAIVAGPRLQIDTSASDSTQHGHGRGSPVVLDTAAGFTIDFQLQVNSETHASGDRSGFSLLVQGADPSKAVQLSFWEGVVWASDAVFAKAESSAHTTTGALQSYSLQVAGNQFTLKAGATPLLTNVPLRDFPTTANPLTAVYGFSNYVWLGDNTTSARALVELGAMTVTAVPEPASALLLLGGIAGLAGSVSRRRAR